MLPILYFLLLELYIYKVPKSNDRYEIVVYIYKAPKALLQRGCNRTTYSRSYSRVTYVFDDTHTIIAIRRTVFGYAVTMIDYIGIHSRLPGLLSVHRQ